MSRHGLLVSPLETHVAPMENSTAATTVAAPPPPPASDDYDSAPGTTEEAATGEAATAARSRPGAAPRQGALRAPTDSPLSGEAMDIDEYVVGDSPTAFCSLAGEATTVAEDEPLSTRAKKRPLKIDTRPSCGPHAGESGAAKDEPLSAGRIKQRPPSILTQGPFDNGTAAAASAAGQPSQPRPLMSPVLHSPQPIMHGPFHPSEWPYASKEILQARKGLTWKDIALREGPGLATGEAKWAARAAEAEATAYAATLQQIPSAPESAVEAAGSGCQRPQPAAPTWRGSSLRRGVVDPLAMAKPVKARSGGFFQRVVSKEKPNLGCSKPT